jgi:hypothetical protein
MAKSDESGIKKITVRTNLLENIKTIISNLRQNSNE